MAAVERGGTDVKALFVGDFLRRDEVVGVTSASRSNCGIERMIEKISKSYARRRGVDGF